jgi:3',5'-cyclic-AMP phosphodiesterase
VLIAQISDVHVGGGRYRQELLRNAIDEINAAEPDLVVVAGDLTDDGYPDQYPLAREELACIACGQVVRVPGNHDARNVGYLRFEDTFGARDSRLRLEFPQGELALVAVDSSKPTSTRASLDASTTAGSRKVSGETPTYASSSATTT